MTRLLKNCLCFALLGLLPLSVRALDPAQPPGGNFDLSHWKIQLPTSNGILTGTGGSVDEKTAAQLSAGFTNAFFYTATDGAMTFWTPDNGATTSGSSHPRSELREMINPNDSGVNWNLNGFHLLTAQLKVLQVPSDTQKVCLGQIHQPNYLTDGVTPSANNEQMFMFDLGNQKIYANINLDGNQSSTFSKTFISGASVATNTLINYSLCVSNGLLRMVLNNVTNAWNLYSGTNYQGHIAQNWTPASSNTVYFKAGSYNQTVNTCGCSNDGARVAFYSLTRWHSAAITNQPAGVVSGPGSNVTFTVGAIGNSALSYQWRLNGSNLPTATGTALQLTNLTAANVGNYTVLVTDPTPGFSSITSSVAALTGNFPPVITTQPSSLVVATGSNATFSVSATGIAPLAYRWWFNTNSLPGATNTTLVATNAQLTNAGNYFVIVSNSLGMATSSIAVLSVGSAAVTSTNVWLDALWLDGIRTNTALPVESAWFANNGASLTAAPGALVGAVDPSVTLTWWTYFTSNGPVHLGIGDLLRLKLKFTVGGSAPANGNRGLRLGLFNSAGGTRTTADGSNPNGAGYTGYLMNMNFGSTVGLSSPLQFLERTNLPSANLLSTVNDYVVLGQGGPAVSTPAFSNGIPYTMVFTAKRNSGSVDLSLLFSATNGWSESYAVTDATATNADFDMFVFRPAAQPQTATNFTFTEFAVEMVATNNHLPVAGYHAFTTTANSPLTLATTNLIASDSDPDGDALTVTAVSVTSSNGGLVTLSGGSISYTPEPDFTGSDSFSYTLTDARGASATGYVLVTVVAPLNFSSVSLVNQQLQLAFTGVPSTSYVLQAKSNLTGAPWENIATNLTDGAGTGLFSDIAVLLPQRYFRIVTP